MDLPERLASLLAAAHDTGSRGLGPHGELY